MRSHSTFKRIMELSRTCPIVERKLFLIIFNQYPKLLHTSLAIIIFLVILITRIITPTKINPVPKDYFCYLSDDCMHENLALVLPAQACSLGNNTDCSVKKPSEREKLDVEKKALVK